MSNDSGKNSGNNSGGGSSENNRVIAFDPFRKAAQGSAQQDNTPKTDAEPARFQKHEMTAIFNLRAEYSNVAKDYVICNEGEQPVIAFLAQAGDPDALLVFLKASSGRDAVYMVAGAQISSLSSPDLRDVLGHARDFMAQAEAHIESEKTAQTRRKGFRIV